MKKVWNTSRITKMWYRDMKLANSVGKNSADGLAQCKVATSLHL